jgi:hypothetical protein
MEERIPMIRLTLVLFAVVSVVTPPSASAQEQRGGGTGASMSAKQREREKKAVTAFAAGRYEEAVNLYAELYADFRDPVYLRNIGRCYQKLRDPDRAISSFEEYLAKVKRITALEEDEVNGYIRELKEQKATQSPASSDSKPPSPAAPTADQTPPPAARSGTAPSTPALPAPPTAAPSTAVPLAQAAPPPARPGSLAAAGPPAQGGSPAPAATLEASAPAPSERGGAPRNRLLRRVGQVAVAAGAALGIAGGVALATSWSKYSDAKNGGCFSGGQNRCGEAADSIASRNTLTRVLFGAAAVAGIGGGVLWYLHPVSSDTAAVSPAGLAAGFHLTY